MRQVVAVLVVEHQHPVAEVAGVTHRLEVGRLHDGAGQWLPLHTVAVEKVMHEVRAQIRACADEFRVELERNDDAQAA